MAVQAYDITDVDDLTEAHGVATGHIIANFYNLALKERVEFHQAANSSSFDGLRIHDRSMPFTVALTFTTMAELKDFFLERGVDGS